MATELGVAYITLTASAKGISKAITQELGGVDREFEKQGEKSGGRFAGALSKGLKRAGAAAAGAVGIGAALTKGFGRLVAIDDARGKLRGLGHDAASIDTIMTSALASVKGTAFGLGDAATLAANAVAAGIKPGQELTDRLKLTGDAATIAGVSLSEMGSIFGTVQAGQRAYTSELNMLANRGIPIYQWLQDELGVSQEALRKMVEAGEIDSATFFKVIQDNIGGAALESGKTFRGSLENVMAAVGRLGAAFLEPVFTQMPGVFGGIIDRLDGLAPAADSAGRMLGSAFAGAGAALGQLWSAVSPLGEAFANLWVIVEPLAAGLARLAVGALVAGWHVFLAVLNTVIPAIVAVTGFMREHETLFRVIGALIAAVFIPHWVALGVAATVSGAAQAAAWVGTQARAVAAGAVHSWATLQMIGGWVRMSAAAAVSGAQTVAIWAMLQWDAAKAAAATVLAHAQMAAAWVGTQVRAVAAGAVVVGQWIAMQAAALVSSAATVAANVAAGASFVAQQIAILASAAAMGVVRGATVAWTAVQWLLNAALSANPIGLVIVALAALGAGLVIAWQRSETFRAIVTAAWDGIKSAAGAVVGWFTGTALPTLQAIWDRVAAGFVWLRDTTITTVRGLADGAVAIFVWFRDTSVAAARALADGAMAAVTWLRDNTIAGVRVLADTAVATFNWWRDTSVAVARALADLVVGIVVWLRDTTIAGVRALADGAVAIFNWWRDTSVAVAQVLADLVVGRVVWLRDTTVAGVRALADLAVGIFNWWRDTSVNVATTLANWVVDRVIGLKDRAVQTVRDMGNLAVGSLTWLRDAAASIAGTLRDWVETRFLNLKDATLRIFDAMVGGARRIWDGLKEAAAKPVRFVIETVLNDGLIAGANKILDFIKLPLIPEVPVPGFARGGVLPGPGTSAGDDMLVVDRHGRPRATVASGEPVISRKAYARHKDLIDGIISGRSLPGYFLGGTLPTTPGRISRHRHPYYGTQWAGDLARPAGAPVFAWKAGTVAQTRRSNVSYGNQIVINHGDGSSRYAHLSQIGAAVGQAVAAGQRIGAVGSTGNSTGPHLHFELIGKVMAVLSDLGQQVVQGAAALFDHVGEWFQKPVDALMARVPGAGLFADIAKGVASKAVSDAAAWLRDKLPFGDDQGIAGPPGVPGSLRTAGAVTPNTRKKGEEILAAARGAGHHVGNVWGYDPNPGNPEHHSRRALDFMVNTKPAGDYISDFVWRNRGRYGLQHLIWWQRIMSVGRAAEGWRQMANRGNRTQNHMDHPHVLFGPQDAYLRGTRSSGRGPAWLSEDGRPELVIGPQIGNLLSRSRVLNADQTAAMMGGGNQYYFQPVMKDGTADLRREFEDFVWRVEQAVT